MPKLLTRALALCLIMAAGCVPTQKEQPPQAPAAPSYPTVGGATMYPHYTLFQNLQNSDDHNTLVAAVTGAGAATILSGEHGYTLFAPTDAAFRLLPNGTIEALMHPASKFELTGVVNAHIVPGAKSRSDIMADIQSGGGRATYRTQGGSTLRVTMEGGRMIVADENGRRASVAQADIKSSNGVFHVVEAVLLPS